MEIQKKKDWFVVFTWSMIGLSFVISLVVNPIAKLNQPAFVFLAALPLVCVHGIRRYGWKGFITFAIATYVISTFWEWLSINTGFPFGNYHYTIEPKIVGVSFMIGPAYISLGYICWQVANMILCQIDLRISKISDTVIASGFAAIVMTIFDLATDSNASTIDNAWVWEEGGAMFGVPLSNFLGWWFCTFSFYIVFTILIRYKMIKVKQESNNAVSVLPFLIIYINMGLTVIVQTIFKFTGTGTVTDETGYVWKISDINEASVLWVIFGMFVLVLIAFVNYYKIGLPKQERHIINQNEKLSEGKNYED